MNQCSSHTCLEECSFFEGCHPVFESTIGSVLGRDVGDLEAAGLFFADLVLQSQYHLRPPARNSNTKVKSINTNYVQVEGESWIRYMMFVI